MNENEINSIIKKKFAGAEFFNEKIFISDVYLNLSGVFYQKNDLIIFGSSASFDESCTLKARCEFLERASLIIGSENKHSLEVKYKKSLTNGVAFHTSYEKAKRLAFLERVERDAILRSWYEDISPKKVALDGSEISEFIQMDLKGFTKRFKTSFYKFHSPFSGISVMGSFLEDKMNHYPMIYGFAADEEFNMAIRGSFREAFQRLGFLWEESFSQDLSFFCPTSEYHQDYYLQHKNKFILKKWLEGNSSNEISLKKLEEKNLNFREITPIWLKNKAYVISCDAGEVLLPLYFGFYPYRKGYSDLAPHPIC